MGTTFTPVANHFRIPHELSFGGAANAVAVTDDDRVLVFNRGGSPSVVVLDKAGNYLTRWGVGEFACPHSVVYVRDDAVFLVDTGTHRVEQRDVDGKLVRVLGQQGGAARLSGDPFAQPTDVAVHPVTGDIFVTDGYGNARVHHFDAAGRHVKSWGEPGTGPGQFAIPHALCFVDEGTLAVCDRENYRVQLFDLDGTWLEEWHAFRPSCIRPGQGPLAGLLIVSHLHPPRLLWDMPDIGHSVSLYDRAGTRVGGFGGGPPGYGWDQILSPHFIDSDSEGSIYLAETTSRVLAAVGIDRPPTSNSSHCGNGRCTRRRSWRNDRGIPITGRRRLHRHARGGDGRWHRDRPVHRAESRRGRGSRRRGGHRA